MTSVEFMTHRVVDYMTPAEIAANTRRKEELLASIEQMTRSYTGALSDVNQIVSDYRKD